MSRRPSLRVHDLYFKVRWSDPIDSKTSFGIYDALATKELLSHHQAYW